MHAETATRRQPGPTRSGNRWLAFLSLWVLSTWGASGAVPALVSVMPPSSSTGVASNTEVRFTFSEPMATKAAPADVRFVVTGQGAWRSWTPSWTADSRTLICTPTSPWPQGALVTWATGTNFANQSGVWMTNTYQGAFQIEPGPGWSTNTWSRFLITRTDRYDQSGTNTPSRAATNGCAFAAAAELPADRLVDTITLQLPGNATETLQPATLEGSTYTFEEEGSDTHYFDVTYLPGYYRFNITLGTQVQQVFNLLPAAAAPLTLQNLDPLSAVPINQDFALHWLPRPQANLEDFVQLLIEGTEVRSPDHGQPGALTGLATNWSLPAGQLRPSQSYTVTLLTTESWASTNTLEAYTAESHRTVETRFQIHTAPSPPPRMHPPELLPGGSVRLTATATPGIILILESAPDLPGNPWKLEGSTNLTSESVQMDVPLQGERRFFRLRAP